MLLARGTAVSPFPSVGGSRSKLLARLRYKHLCLLVALDEHRNLHRAARVVHLSQPSASKVVQDLELLFRTPLFDRLPTGMQPTELGAVVLAFARHALGDLKRVANLLDQRREARGEQLIVGVTTNLLPGSVAQAVLDLKRSRPRLVVKFHTDSPNELIDQLVEGAVDLVLGSFGGDVPPDAVACEVVYHDPLCVVARRQHPLADEDSLDLPDVERGPWIIHPHMNSSGEVVQRLLVRAGLRPPSNALESNSLAMTMNLLLHSDSITILPESIARDTLQAGQVVRLPVAVDGESVEFAILTRREEAGNRVGLEFRASLVRHAKTLIHPGRRDQGIQVAGVRGHGRDIVVRD
jgi:DNA-binding transcriptional LysR family regulator